MGTAPSEIDLSLALVLSIELKREDGSLSQVIVWPIVRPISCKDVS